jgi:positive regulator of sigma E activity
LKYVEDTGVVLVVGPEKATIRLDHKRAEDCHGCCACSTFGGEAFTVDVERGRLQEGDHVRVRIPRANEYLSMLLVFGLPLALFMGGIAVGRAFESTERVGTAAMVGGLVGLGVAFLLAWIVNRTLIGKAVPEASRLPAEEQDT